jgi:hypothetical protein
MSRDWDVPIHYLSIVAIVALDIIWGFLEGWSALSAPLFVLILSLIVGLAGGMAVYYVQRFMAHDEQHVATAKAIVMGIVAGVPFMVTGTVLGLTIMVWLAAASIFKGGGKTKRSADDADGRPFTTSQIVSREVRKYAFDGKGTNTRLFPLLDDTHQTYGVLSVGYPMRGDDALVVVMARVMNDTVIIEEDTTTTPLVDALIAKGIPRAKIVLAYAGESTEAYPSTLPLPAYD